VRRRPLLPPPRLAALLALAWPLGANAQGVPNPGFTVVDPLLVGSPLGIAITQVGGMPGFDVYAKDVNNAPLVGAVVEIDFTFSGLTLYATQNAGATIDCATHCISRVTDAQGHVMFAAQFARWQNNNAVPVLLNDVEVAQVKGRSPDYDEDGRVGDDRTGGSGDLQPALYRAGARREAALPAIHRGSGRPARSARRRSPAFKQASKILV